MVFHWKVICSKSRGALTKTFLFRNIAINYLNIKNLIFEDLPSEMESVLDKLSNLKEELRAIKENFRPKETVDLLTREETAESYKGLSLTNVVLLTPSIVLRR
jgi:hypothetical protein